MSYSENDKINYNVENPEEIINKLQKKIKEME